MKAIETLAPLVKTVDLERGRENPGAMWRKLTGDSQLRWLGPDKGVMHLATGAVVNAIWDLWGKQTGKPVWRMVAEMDAGELLKIVDFHYLTDALDPAEALDLLKEGQNGKRERVARLEREGYPCYTTSAGWLGYPDEKLRGLCRQAKDAGFGHVKTKVGRDLADDVRRLRIAREELGENVKIMIDANQVWEVEEAVKWIRELAFAHPYFIEEPTSPDDVAGHKAIREAVRPIKVATGEMCQNRVMFKQFIVAGAVDVVQVDASRLGGLNEVFAVQLLARKFGLPVWPHAGGVGLCEYVQHLSMIDYAVVCGVKDDRRAEYVDHLHEHFVFPCRVENGAYLAPADAGFSIEIQPASLVENAFRP